MAAPAIDLVSVGKEHGQKCWINPSTLASLNGRLSCYVLVSDIHSDFICQAWPSEQVTIDTVCYSGMVHKQNTDAKNLISNIKCLTTEVCRQIHVTLVVNHYKRVKKIKLDLKLHPGKVENLCRNLLFKVCIAKDFKVSVGNSQLAEVYGIDSLNVNGTDTSDFDGYVINQETKLCVQSVVSKERATFSSKPVNIGGVQEQAEELCELLKIPFHCRSTTLGNIRAALPKGILLRGPPGTGKTTLVRHVADQCNAYVVTVNGPEVFGARPGETEENMKEILDKVLTLSEEGPTILFLDEVDTLCPNQQDYEGNKEVNCKQLIMNFFDKIVDIDNIMVIGATNRPTSVDKGLRRPGRFDKEIMVNIPNLSQRLDILKKITKTLPMAADVDLDRLAYITNGYVGADLVALTREAALMVLVNNEKVKEIEMHYFEEAVHKIMPSIKKGTVGLVELSPVYWSQIGGLAEVKAQIQQAVEWPIRHPEAFQRMGLPCPKGVLLYGPPGCCKTTLVRAAATATNATFIALSGAQLYSPYIGDSERLISEVFQKARAAAPSIIFLDELDSIVGKRSDGSSNRGVQERILSTLLNEMDGIGTRLDDKIDTTEKVLEGENTDKKSNERKIHHSENKNVLLVAATNRPDLVDDALIRPGRVDRILYVPPPDREARQEILRLYTDKMPVKDVDISHLSEMTEFFSGADLQNLCREAALLALTDDIQASCVTMEHFIEALQIADPSLTEAVMKQYSKITSKPS